MADEKYQQLLKSCYGQITQGQGRNVIFTSAGNKALSTILGSFLQDLDPGAILLRSSGPKFQKPFFPLLEWVREHGAAQAFDWESIISQAGVYPLHQNLFLMEMEGRLPERNEEVVHEELPYERHQIYKGLGALFCQVFKEKPVVLILEDINHYPVATLKALGVLLGELKPSNLMTIMTVDERRVVENTHGVHAWEALFNQLGPLALTLGLNASDGKSLWKNEETRPTAMTIRHLETFLCLEDCLWLDEYYSLRPQEIDSPEEEEISLALGNVYYLLGDYSTAVLLYRNLLKWERGRGEVSLIILIYRRLSFLSFVRNNIQEAKKWATQALKLAQNTGQEEELFYSIYLILILDSREHFLPLPEWEQLLGQLIELGEAQGKLNNLAYRLSKPDRFNPVDHADRIDSQIAQAIKIVSKLGNELRLANAYHIRGYSRLLKGDFDSVMPLYQKSEALRKRLGNPLELSYLYNGTGYFLHQRGDFKKAIGYLQKSAEYALEAGDYHEICMGVCNMAINDLYSFQAERAAFLLGKVIQIMNILEIKNLSFHSFREVVYLYGVAMFISGHPDRAYEKYSLIISLGLQAADLAKTSTEQDEILVENLFHCRMHLHEGDQEKALEILEKAFHTLMANKEIILYRIPYVAVLLGDLHREQGNQEKAHHYYSHGLVASQEGGYQFYEEVLLGRLNGSITFPVLSRKEKGLDFERILENAKASMDLQKLHKVVEKLDILSTFRQLLDSEEETRILVVRALNLINTAFPSDLMVFSYYSEEGWQVYQENFSSTVQWNIQSDFVGLQDVLWKHHSQLTQQSKPYKKVLACLPFETYVHVPIGSGSQKKAHLFLASYQSTDFGQVDDLKILELAAFQLSGVLEKRYKDEQLAKANKALEKLAVTDPLTSLFNRGALMSRLAEERERTVRYGKKKGGSFSIVFIDLDNFKTYNDTFGHKIGDQCLQLFAHQVRSHLRNVDFSCRYGGDEFVLILPETSAKDAQVVTNRILKAVKEGQVFENIILEVGGDPSIIPPERKLGCSMGIAEFPRDSDADVNQLLILADRALYKAKNLGKNLAVIHE